MISDLSPSESSTSALSVVGWLWQKSMISVPQIFRKLEDSEISPMKEIGYLTRRGIEEHMTGIRYIGLSSSAPQTSPQVQSYPPRPLLGTLSLELGLQHLGSLWLFDCRGIASASPVAVQPLVVVVSSGVGSGSSPRRRSGSRPYSSASAFVQIRSDRCLAQRLGENKRQRVSMHGLCITRECCWVESMPCLFIFDMVS